MPKLLIGWSETDTTPDGPVDLCGQYYHRISTGIHSRLSATVLALESPTGDQAVMASLDLVGTPSDFQGELRDRLRPALPDLDVSKVFLNAIHTHSAPGINRIRGIGWLKELPGVLPMAEYRAFLLDRLAAAVAKAWRCRKPGGLAGALGFARVGHCRRAVYADAAAEMYGRTDRPDFTGLEGGEDSGVDLLFFFDRRGKPSGAILNLACPSQVMESTYRISADFMGEVRQRLKKTFGPGFRVLGQISAAGCQSPRDLTRRYRGEPDFWHEDGVAELGRRLELAVRQAFPRAALHIDYAPELRHRVLKLALPRRRASRRDFLEARRQLAKLEKILPEDRAYARFCAEVSRNEKIPGRPGPYDSKLHHFVLIQNAKAVLARYREQARQPAFEIESHLVRLGDVALATNPFELYLDYGQRIKARSPANQTFVVQLCAGVGGYLPSARAEQLGGYGGLIINGQVGSEGGAKLVDESVKALARLWKE